MKPSISWRPVALASIAAESRWNLHPWCTAPCPRELEQSFELAGILHPPLLVSTPKGWQLLAGRRRLQYAAKRQMTEICCGVIDAGSGPEFFAGLLQIALEDQKNAGELSICEKARILEIAAEGGGEALVSVFLQRLEVSKNSAEAALLQQLPALGNTLLAEIHNNRISAHLCRELLDLSPSARLRLCRLFVDELGIGGGKQRRLFYQLRDCAGKDGRSIDELLASPEVAAILENDSQNRPLKNRLLSDWLQERLFPESREREKRFRNEVQQLPLPPGAELSHSPAFEKDELLLTLTFANMAECQHWLSTNSQDRGTQEARGQQTRRHRVHRQQE